MNSLRDFAELIKQEREIVGEKYGEQIHGGHAWLSLIVEEVGELAQAVNDLCLEPDGSGPAININPRLAININNKLVQIAELCYTAWEQAARKGVPLAPNWSPYMHKSYIESWEKKHE